MGLGSVEVVGVETRRTRHPELAEKPDSEPAETADSETCRHSEFAGKPDAEMGPLEARNGGRIGRLDEIACVRPQ
jgi:hypothetical protein